MIVRDKEENVTVPMFFKAESESAEVLPVNLEAIESPEDDTCFADKLECRHNAMCQEVEISYNVPVYSLRLPQTSILIVSQRADANEGLVEDHGPDFQR